MLIAKPESYRAARLLASADRRAGVIKSTLICRGSVTQLGYVTAS
jgi:hypothetical protein